MNVLVIAWLVFGLVIFGTLWLYAKWEAKRSR